ncbi:RAB6-interacting golgin [Hetaerina americana]|uniref:RAB6-interacting golgin n=1 Tax=Hetaerina americana TaxID=62018 RepID=UPI003A7F4F47
MQGKWEGFTDEDLQSMSESDISASSNASQRHNGNAQRRNKEERVKVIKPANIQTQSKDDNAIQPLGEKNDTVERVKPNGVEASIVKSEQKADSPNMSTVCLKIKNDVAYEVLRNEGKIKSEDLTEFHFRQKMMEEQNRKKKELLAQALAERKKRTYEEANRLHKINEELQKLDNLLSNDVSILRDQIEAASLEYTVAQKRFDRAEKEYLDAKLILTGKLERKELLTAHLCTIIEQNELRKAQKLSELMEKLQITASDA